MPKIVGSEELVTIQECKHSSATCYKNNIQPIMEEIKKISEQLNCFEKKMIKVIAEMPGKLEEKFDNRYAEKHTEQEVDKIQGNINKLVWLVIGAVVVGVLNLVIK